MDGSEETTVNRERLLRLQRLSEQVRLGGKGSMRRKKKATGTRSNATDDKKLHAAIKRLGLSQIPQIDEINMFKDDGTVLTFALPKLQANISANTYVLSGAAPQQRRMEDLLDDVGMLSQLGPENLAQIQQLMQQLSTQEKPSDVPDVSDADFEAAAAQATEASPSS
jgi:nascent polypeptide-associated complex subunit beta